MEITKIEFIKRRRPETRNYNAVLPNGRSKFLNRDFYAAEREYLSATRVYVFPKEYSVEENLVNRRNRPYAQWKPIVERALAERGLTGKLR